MSPLPFKSDLDLESAVLLVFPAQKVKYFSERWTSQPYVRLTLTMSVAIRSGTDVLPEASAGIRNHGFIDLRGHRGRKN